MPDEYFEVGAVRQIIPSTFLTQHPNGTIAEGPQHRRVRPFIGLDNGGDGMLRLSDLD